MSAKLARLEQQEAEFMAKYGKKSQAASATSQSAVEDQRKNCKSNGDVRELIDKEAGNPETDVEIKKKKKKRAEDTEVVPEANGDMICVQRDSSDKTKSKKKNTGREEESPSCLAGTFGSPVETTELVNKKKKKKKKRKSPELQCDDVAEKDTEESHQAEPTQHCPLEGKRNKARVLMESADAEEQQVTVKQKRKKCKKDKVRDEGNEEDLPSKKKKKKKSQE